MSKPRLIKYWADWCVPCHKSEPIFAAMEQEFADRIEFERVDIDLEPRRAEAVGIRSVPTLLLFKHPDVIDLTPWVMFKYELRSRILNALED